MVCAKSVRTQSRDAPAMTDTAAFDAYLFGRMFDLAAREAERPLSHALGLPRRELLALARRHLPERLPALATSPRLTDETGADALEEADLRGFLREHGARGTDEETWLAAIIARRSLAANHLWQDLGLADRCDLNRLFRRHFPALVALNAGDMKWKKFFYRQLCQREGIPICKSPNCESCVDVADCFGVEAGQALM